MGNFRVYAIGGVKYLDIEDEAITDVEDLYPHAALRRGPARNTRASSESFLAESLRKAGFAQPGDELLGIRWISEWQAADMLNGGIPRVDRL